MIEVNLLPHREAKRAADLRQTVGVLGLGLVVVAGVIALVDRGVRNDHAAATASVRQLEADIERYRPEEEQVAGFKEKRRELEDKLDVIRGLDRARSGPVRILDELSNSTPDRLWLTVLSTNDTVHQLSIPPPVTALLPLTVLLARTSWPSLRMPPPLCASLPLMVVFSRAAMPMAALRTPPPPNRVVLARMVLRSTETSPKLDIAPPLPA